MSRLNRWSWFAARTRRYKTPRSRQRIFIGSSYGRRLRVESLEERRLLAAVTVGNNLDVVNGTTTSIAALIASPGADGISLREAIQAANANSDADEISFAAGLSGQTILLTGGELEISWALTIDAGALDENVTIDAQQLSRVMNFTRTVGDLTLAGLNLRNGKTTSMGTGAGGGISFHSSGILTLNQSTLADNSTAADFADGGGISARVGSVVLNQSTVSGNSTAGVNAHGGGIFVYTGSLTLNESVITGNTTSQGNSGGGIYTFSAPVTLNHSTISENFTHGDGATGGGLYARNATIVLNQSTVSGNGTIDDDADGGGIYLHSGALTLNQSTVSDNRTEGNNAKGGGIYARYAAVRLNQSTVSGNFTTASNARGGGIAAYAGAVRLYGSTLSGNSTAGTNADGGGLYKGSGAVTFIQSTITRNSTMGSGSDGGGIFVTSNSPFPDPVVGGSSILAGNTVAAGSTGPDLVADPDATVAIIFSVIGTGIPTDPLDENISTNDPRLALLADNGGPTQTHALLPGSPAIEAGDLMSLGEFAHVYELNGSLADALGGPALVANGGTLSATGYDFDPNQGLSLSSAVASDEYTIELVFSSDELGGYQKIIDFHNLGDDGGLYSIGNSLHFFPPAFAEAVLPPAGTPTQLVVTRDGPSDVVAVYVDGVQVISFVDSGNAAVFNGPGQVIWFFQDDIIGDDGRPASGFVDRIRVYDRNLSASEVAVLGYDQRGAGFPRVVDGDRDGVARIDAGAYEFAIPLLVVNDSGDGDDGNIYNGTTELREAINAANAMPGADVITFAAGMSGQTILLSGAELEIMDSLSIDATALAENVTIDAQQLSRVIYIGSASFDPVDVTLGGLTIQNGKTTGVNFTSGGGILFGFTGTLELNRSKVTGNSTEGLEASGGGISAYEVAVTLINSEVSNNSTLGDRADGGGVRSRNGAVTLVGSTVSGNRTTGMDAKGGGIFSPNGDVTLNDSTLSGNSTMGASAHGGGIYAPSNVTLNQSTLSGNSTAGESASGGGIFTSFGAVTLNQSTLSGNSTAGDNSKGGGILTNSGAVTLASSTLSGNSTVGLGAHGGGIFTRYGVVTLHQSTLTGNSTAGASASGGGIIVTNGAVVAPVTIRNSIVAGNTVAAGSTGPDLVAGSGSPTTVNFSLIGTGITPAAGGNNFSTNAPVLGPLTFNGGPTQTHALLPGSPALDAADPNGGAAHNYELNGSQTDALGGSVLIAAGGVLTATGYQFGPNQGLNLSGAVAADEYSIEMVFSFDALGGYQKIIDFKNLTNDNGIYSTGTNLDFFGGGAFANNVFTAAVPAHLVVTRDADTERVAVYIDAVEVLNFVDAGDVAVFSGPSQIIRFFQDDAATGGSEAAAGFVDRIRIYDRDLSAAEVAGLVFDQRGAPFVRVFDGDGLGGARIDVGAFESNVQLPDLWGDYNQNGVVDAADYTVWRNTLGQTNVTPYSGADGSGDGTIGPEDYGVWKSHYGETLPPGAGGGAASLTLAEPVFQGGEAVVPLPAESIAAPVEADAVRASGWAMFAARSARHDSAAPPRERTNSFRVGESASDQLLLLLASDRLGHSSQQDLAVVHNRGNEDHHADDLNQHDFFNDPLALALAEWQ